MGSNFAGARIREECMEEFRRDIYCILTDKMGVGSMSKIKRMGENGIRAYKVLRKWSTDISDIAKSDRLQKLMSPERAKRDEDVADAIVTWDIECRELKLLDPECDFPKPPFSFENPQIWASHKYQNLKRPMTEDNFAPTDPGTLKATTFH